MDYKQKYKQKYKMALEAVQEILNSGSDSIKMSMLRQRFKSVFPELEESEDERIRKEQGEQTETPCDRCSKAMPYHSCQDITELGRCYAELERKVYGRKD